MKELIKNRLNTLYGITDGYTNETAVKRVIAHVNQVTDDYKADIAEEWAHIHGFEPLAREKLPDCMFAGYVAFAKDRMKSRRALLGQTVLILREYGYNVTIDETDFIRYHAE